MRILILFAVLAGGVLAQDVSKIKPSDLSWISGCVPFVMRPSRYGSSVPPIPLAQPSWPRILSTSTPPA